MKVAFDTLGCKVNQNDTQSLMAIFQGKGYEIVPFEALAGIYIINTCAVTRVGERKSRQTIRRAIDLNPGAIIVVTGCYAQTSAGEVAGIPGVNLVVGMADRSRIVELVEEFIRSRRNLVSVGEIEKSTLWSHRTDEIHTRRTRAFLKIEEGCDQFCSYCIVPYARGRVRSMPPEQVMAEFAALLESGYKEIVLTGIHLGSYGKDSGAGLPGLLKELLTIEGHYRIRLGSIEPNDFGPELIETIMNSPKICRHLHIPLQSGNDRILKLMNRGYDGAYFSDLLVKIREWDPMVAIGTDLIMGFPGETEEDFASTCRFVLAQAFSRVHVFRFSPRQGTPANELPDRVPKAVQEERSKKIQAIASQSFLEYAGRFIGMPVEVLFEEEIAHGWIGLSGEYVKVETRTGENLKNFLGPVLVTGMVGESLVGVNYI
jgi:threonylcarbamoyladenosine tRNA methylthiotransferase MtaB